MDRDARVAALQDRIAPALETLGLDLFDLHLTGAGKGRTLRVTVERDGGVDLDTIAAASQAITPLLDDEPTLAGSYLLEVTSPGVERTLRRPEHFRRAVGETVSVKYRTDAGTERRRGELAAADDDHIDVVADGEPHRIPLAAITDARTVFDWGPAPRPGGGGKAGSKSAARKKEKSRS
jgi:ribosome maturation factor RimP